MNSIRKKNSRTFEKNDYNSSNGIPKTTTNKRGSESTHSEILPLPQIINSDFINASVHRKKIEEPKDNFGVQDVFFSAIEKEYILEKPLASKEHLAGLNVLTDQTNLVNNAHLETKYTELNRIVLREQEINQRLTKAIEKLKMENEACVKEIERLKHNYEERINKLKEELTEFHTLRHELDRQKNLYENIKKSYEVEISKMEEVKINLERKLEGTLKNASEEEVWRTKYEDVWRRMVLMEDENTSYKKMNQILETELKKRTEEKREIFDSSERKVNALISELNSLKHELNRENIVKSKEDMDLLTKELMNLKLQKKSLDEEKERKSRQLDELEVLKADVIPKLRDGIKLQEEKEVKLLEENKDLSQKLDLANAEVKKLKALMKDIESFGVSLSEVGNKLRANESLIQELETELSQAHSECFEIKQSSQKMTENYFLIMTENERINRIKEELEVNLSALKKEGEAFSFSKEEIEKDISLLIEKFNSERKNYELEITRLRDANLDTENKIRLLYQEKAHIEADMNTSKSRTHSIDYKSQETRKFNERGIIDEYEAKIIERERVITLIERKAQQLMADLEMKDMEIQRLYMKLDHLPPTHIQTLPVFNFDRQREILLESEIQSLKDKLFSMDQEVLHLKGERERLQSLLSEQRAAPMPFLRPPNLRELERDNTHIINQNESLSLENINLKGIIRELEERLGSEKRFAQELDLKLIEKTRELELWVDKYRKQEDVQKFDVQNILSQYDQTRSTIMEKEVNILRNKLQAEKEYLDQRYEQQRRELESVLAKNSVLVEENINLNAFIESSKIKNKNALEQAKDQQSLLRLQNEKLQEHVKTLNEELAVTISSSRKEDYENRIRLLSLKLEEAEKNFVHMEQKKAEKIRELEYFISMTGCNGYDQLEIEFQNMKKANFDLKHEILKRDTLIEQLEIDKGQVERHLASKTREMEELIKKKDSYEYMEKKALEYQHESNMHFHIKKSLEAEIFSLKGKNDMLLAEVEALKKSRDWYQQSVEKYQSEIVFKNQELLDKIKEIDSLRDSN